MRADSASRLSALPAAAAIVTATYPTATTVPVTAASYTATGNTVNFSLNFAPPAGTNLTVVKNTGMAFIQGAFDNLAQGRKVNLTYGGVTYPFVANYFGGSGNDLMLQWAGVRLLAWGANTYGQLGTNGLADAHIPTSVEPDGVLAGKQISSLSAGQYHTLALCTDGTLVAWGYNNRGQLGNNSTASSKVPVTIGSFGALAGKTVVATRASGAHSLALCADGTLAAWGWNPFAST